MTAEEFLKIKGCGSKTQNGVDYYYDVTLEDIIEFAKYHVEQALKTAEENLEYTTENHSEQYVVPDSILNAYPLENIK